MIINILLCDDYVMAVPENKFLLLSDLRVIGGNGAMGIYG